MTPFPTITDLIGKIGILFVAKNGQSRFWPVEEMPEFYKLISPETADKIATAIGTYNPFTHYLRLESGGSGFLLYLIDQGVIPGTGDIWLRIGQLLLTPQFKHPDRNFLWFKALAASELQPNFTFAEKLTFFKLRADEYRTLKPLLDEYQLLYPQ